ncbi:MAG TPA: winged helix-turn-helix domain-containing protein [Blastocatellia bacterium]|nr:winged helix-turn-helix domain-containing protein [Blastocatellia bacterium]
MATEPSRFYAFGAFRLDADEHELSREGAPVPVASKAMDVLLILIENAGQVLERSELIKRVWPDSEGADGSLAVTVSALRKTLGDRPDGGPYIETLPRQGYRFAASVTASFEKAITSEPTVAALGRTSGVGVAEQPDQPGGASADSVAELSDRVLARGDEEKGATYAAALRKTQFLRWPATHKKIVAAIFAVVIAAVVIGYVVRLWRTAEKRVPVRRLAILPFRNLKPDDQTDFLGPSLANATTASLRSFSSLIVRPSSYVEKYRGVDVDDPKMVADELDVDTLMTGTFLKEGNTLRVTVQLIDVNKGEIISRFPFETRYEKLATVQDQVAHNIIERLQLNLSPTETEQLRRETTADPRAYEYFLRGIDLYARSEFLATVPLLEKAVELDPNFASAWAHLGRAYTACASFNLRGRDFQLKAQAAYEQALAIDRDMIEATVFMANLLTDSNRVEEAVPMLRKLLQSNANIAEARWELGYAYRFGGMLDESIMESERARALDPNVKRTSSAPNAYLYIGQYETFLSKLPTEDGSAFLVFYRGMANYYLKRLEQAAADFDRAYEMDPQLYTRIGKALSYSIKNQKDLALAVVRDVEREIDQKGVGDSEAIYKVAQVYAILGERSSGLRVLRRSIETGFFCYGYLKSDPLLEGLRVEPECQTLLEIARNRHENFQRTFF